MPDLIRPLLRVLVPLLLVIGALTVTPPASQAIPVSPSICYQAYMQGLGWSGTKCNGDMAGTTGQSRRIEAVRVQILNTNWYYCLGGHVQRVGDVSEGGCMYPGGWTQVGTAGSGLRLEQIHLFWRPGSGALLCGYGHVQRMGWLWASSSTGIYLGTTGQALRLEAIRLYVGDDCL